MEEPMMRVTREESPSSIGITTRISAWLRLLSPVMVKTLESKCSLLGSADNFLLVVYVQINELIAVTGDPNQQISVLIRRRLGFAQCLGINDIKLDVMSIEFEISPDEVPKIFDSLFPFKHAG